MRELKQIELTIKELRSFQEFSVLSVKHVDRVKELERITEQNRLTIEKVIKRMKFNVIESEAFKLPRAVIEERQEKYCSVVKVFEEVYGTYLKVKDRLPPADDAAKDRQRCDTKIKNRINRLNGIQIVDRPPIVWMPA